MTALALAWALTSASAVAVEPDRPGPWADIDDNMRTVSKVGIAASIVGPPVALVGLGVTIGSALGNDGDGARVGTLLLLTGLGSTLAGPPLLAGSSLRSRATLAARAQVWPDGRAGTAAWGLFGGSVVLVSTSLVLQNSGEGEVAGVLAIAGAGAYVGSVIAGGVQLHTNRLARRDLATSWDVGLRVSPGGVELVATF